MFRLSGYFNIIWYCNNLRIFFTETITLFCLIVIIFCTNNALVLTTKRKYRLNREYFVCFHRIYDITSLRKCSNINLTNSYLGNVTLIFRVYPLRFVCETRLNVIRLNLTYCSFSVPKTGREPCSRPAEFLISRIVCYYIVI